MINKVGFLTPQYQQKPAFKGEKEVEMLVGLTKDLTKRTTHNMSTLNCRLNEAVKKVSQVDLKDAAKRVDEWQRTVFNIHIKKD